MWKQASSCAGVARRRHLGLAEVETARRWHEVRRLAGVVQQCSEHDPVVRPHGGGTVGAAGGILVESTGAPDVLAVAMHLGVVAGPDAVAVPESPRGLLQGLGGDLLDVADVPGAVLGEGLQGLPVVLASQADQGLGDGVLLVVEGQAGDPLGEAAEAAAVVEAAGVRGQQSLPQEPQSHNFHKHLPGEGQALVNHLTRSTREVLSSTNYRPDPNSTCNETPVQRKGVSISQKRRVINTIVHYVDPTMSNASPRLANDPDLQKARVSPGFLSVLRLNKRFIALYY